MKSVFYDIYQKWKRRLAPLVGATISFCLALLIFAIIPSILSVAPVGTVNSDEFVNSFNRAWKHFFPTLWTLGAVILVTAFVSTAVYHRLILRNEHKNAIAPFKDSSVRGRLFTSLLILTFFTLVLVYVGAAFSESSFWGQIANNPGGWFALVTGIASLLGVYLTFMQVVEVHNTIVSFSDFIQRTQALIDSTENDDVVRIMLHTPATGCLALPRSVWRQLSVKISSGTKKIQITCLSRTEEKLWFERYLDGLDGDRKSEMSRRIADGRDESRLIRDSLARSWNILADDGGTESAVIVGEWKDLSSAYYVANKHKAIVVVPFFLPTLYGNFFSRSLHYRNVDMIGFETSNFHIVDTVLTEIATRRKALVNRQEELLLKDDDLDALEDPGLRRLSKIAEPQEEHKKCGKEKKKKKSKKRKV